jgi:hypothetical protein
MGDNASSVPPDPTPATLIFVRRKIETPFTRPAISILLLAFRYSAGYAATQHA